MARPSHAHYDAVVVGQGICGTALAYALGRRGKRVLALERDLAEPDKIIGELLQPGGVERLTRLGMAECLEGIDSPPILGYAVYPPNGEDPVPLGYPAQHGVRPRGRSFHHGRFIMNLRRKAREACEVFEATVTALNESSDGRVTGVTWRAGRATGTVSADMVFCCDGLFSGLREHFTSSTVKHKSKFVGLILENAASRLPFPHHGHVFCIDPSPTLIYPISSREVRVLVDVPEPVPLSLEEMKGERSELGEDWAAWWCCSSAIAVHLLRVTAPQLPAPLKELFVEAVSKETRLRSMPAGSLHPEPIYRPGAMIVGDAMNVRNPLTGGGMSVAFNDVTVLCDTLFTLESFRDDAAVQKQLKAFYSARKQFSAQINILAQALYEVFSQ